MKIPISEDVLVFFSPGLSCASGCLLFLFTLISQKWIPVLLMVPLFNNKALRTYEPYNPAVANKSWRLCVRGDPCCLLVLFDERIQ